MFGPDAARTPTTQQLLRQTLHELSSRLEKIDQPRSDRGGLPARSGAGSSQHHGLQQVRTERNLGANDHASAETHVADSEASGIHGYYAALMAAARITLSPRDAAALIRNLKNQKIIAVRAANDRLHAARANHPKRPQIILTPKSTKLPGIQFH